MNLQAHDINNQLNIILGICYKLRATPHAMDHLGQSLGLIEHSVYRANILIKEITHGISEPDKNKSFVNITDILNRIVHILSLIVGKDVNIEDHGHHAPFYINGYPQDLEQAFLNLVMNAKEAVGKSGTIVINREILPATDSAYEREYSECRPEILRVTISDTGPGIPDALKQSVFEPFFTTKSSNLGMGLGLSIVAKVIAEHDGRITCNEANSRYGTEICIEIPGYARASKHSCVD
jgi:two-component system, cell cycle sensor histidine kinase and response regulator CckA